LFFVPYPNPATHDYYPLVLVGWTLNYEMLFYLLFALCIWLGRRRSVFVMSGALTILTVLALAGTFLKPKGLAGYFTSPMLFEFALGMVAALFFGKLKRLPLAGVVFLGMIGLVWLLVPAEGLPENRVLRYGAPAFLLLLVAIQESWSLMKWLHRLGDISYSLYLSHFILLSAYAAVWAKLSLGTGLPSRGLFMVCGLVVALTAGYLCWLWVERPLTALARRLLHTRGERIAARS
jgi:exopolysaccharide production protein ExoZ